MTHKHFEAIAAGINHSYTLSMAGGASEEQLKGMRKVVYSMVATFEQECPRFDSEKFMIACGIAYRNGDRVMTRD